MMLEAATGAFFLTLLLLIPTQLSSAQVVSFQPGHTHDILNVKFSPDDSQLISYSAGDGRICLWEIKTGRLLWMTHTDFIQNGREYYNLEQFYWSQDERFVVTKSHNGTYQTWDAKTGRILFISEGSPNISLISDKAKRFSIARDSGSFILSNSGTHERFTIESFSRTTSVYDVSHDGRLIAEGGSWGDASIKLTMIKTGEARFLDGHPGVIHTIAYSPDGKYVAIAGSDKSIYIFDAATHSLSIVLVGHTNPITSIAFSPDGGTVLSSSTDASIKAWSWREGRLLREIKSDLDMFGVDKIQFSPDGRSFLTMSDRVEFRIRDRQTLALVRSIRTAEKYESSDGFTTIGYDAVPVSGAAFSKDGKRILSSHVDGTLRFWDANDGKQIRSLKLGPNISRFQLSPDDTTILAVIGKRDDLRIKRLDTSSGKVIRAFYDEDASYLENVVLSPNGRLFATSNISGDVLLWDVSKKNPIRKLDVGFSGDDAIAFSPDGKTLAVGGRNQNLFLFDVETGGKLWQLIPSYQASDLETRLAKEKERRQAIINHAEKRRERQAAIDTGILKRHVYITFEHYGEMTNPGEQRLAESNKPNKSKIVSSTTEANAIWLRLHNDSRLPIRIPTQSMYLPNPDCSYEFSPGHKILGMCPNREISVWFGLEDRNGKPIPYGFDFGSSAILLPKTSVVFGVPRDALKDNNAINFTFVFQNQADESEIKDYGAERVLRFREAERMRSPRRQGTTVARPKRFVPLQSARPN
jgi:WD40 repeat protein